MDKTKIAVSVFDKMARSYQDKFMDVSLYGDSFDLFCKEIKTQNASVLELACGPGNITKYLLDKRPDLKILGTDLAPNMISLAKNNNPSAEFQLLDCRTILSLGKKFDAIMCGFCLPYLSKEETKQLVSDSYKILNSGGVLYISTMEDDYNKSGLRKGSGGDEIFMHYYEEYFLTGALLENNFTIIDVSRKEYPGQDGSKITDLIILAKKL